MLRLRQRLRSEVVSKDEWYQHVSARIFYMFFFIFHDSGSDSSLGTREFVIHCLYIDMMW